MSNDGELGADSLENGSNLGFLHHHDDVGGDEDPCFVYPTAPGHIEVFSMDIDFPLCILYYEHCLGALTINDRIFCRQGLKVPVANKNFDFHDPDTKDRIEEV